MPSDACENSSSCISSSHATNELNARKFAKQRHHSRFPLRKFLQRHVKPLSIISVSRSYVFLGFQGNTIIILLFFFLLFFPCPICHPRATTLALPPSSNSDPGSHSGPSFPLSPTVRASISSREELLISFLVDSRRIVPTHVSNLFHSAVDPFSIFAFLQIMSKSHRGGNRTQGPTLANTVQISTRWESNSRTNAINSSIRG